MSNPARAPHRLLPRAVEIVVTEHQEGDTYNPLATLLVAGDGFVTIERSTPELVRKLIALDLIEARRVGREDEEYFLTGHVWESFSPVLDALAIITRHGAINYNHEIWTTGS